jgi:hypothetical protein
MDPVSHDIVLEQAAFARDQATWKAVMEQALAALTCPVIASTREAAPGLLASVDHHLGAHHSPDVFQVPPALSQAVSAPMAAQQRAAAKVVVKAAATLHHVHERFHTTTGEPDTRGPGRPATGAAHLEQAEQDMEAARQDPHRLAGQREQGPPSLRALGHASPFVDLERGGRRQGQRIAGDIQRHIETLRTMAPQEGLSQACGERLEKAERVVPKMQATIEFVAG